MKIPNPSRPAALAACHQAATNIEAVAMDMWCVFISPVTISPLFPTPLNNFRLVLFLPSALLAINGVHISHAHLHGCTLYTCAAPCLRAYDHKDSPCSHGQTGTGQGALFGSVAVVGFPVYPSSKILTSKRIYYLEVLMKFIRFILRFYNPLVQKIL